MKRGSLRKPISKKNLAIISEDPYFRVCHVGGDCSGRTEINHAFTYAGRRQDDIWGLVSVCTKHHRQIAKYQDIMRREIVARIYHFGAEEEFRLKYPRSTLRP